MVRYIIAMALPFGANFLYLFISRCCDKIQYLNFKTEWETEQETETEQEAQTGQGAVTGYKPEVLPFTHFL